MIQKTFFQLFFWNCEIWFLRAVPEDLFQGFLLEVPEDPFQGTRIRAAARLRLLLLLKTTTKLDKTYPELRRPLAKGRLNLNSRSSELKKLQVLLGDSHKSP